ncbi:MAG TPA: four helix bundle protein [Candidatus Woesebacteria bacterium]|nr:four helix bundle protein [Candidatus Woesebacteria bacterium]
MKGKIASFTDLEVWKKGHSYVLRIYKITYKFPQEEKYGLGDQLRRAAVSITSNISEGFYRRTSADKVYFYTCALSSLGETQNQIIIALDLYYIDQLIFQQLWEDSMEIQRMLKGLIKSAPTKL